MSGEPVWRYPVQECRGIASGSFHGPRGDGTISLNEIFAVRSGGLDPSVADGDEGPAAA